MAGRHAGGRHQHGGNKYDGDRDHGFNGHRVDGDGFVRVEWIDRHGCVRIRCFRHDWLVQLNRLIGLRHL